MSEPKRPARWSWKWKAAMVVAATVFVAASWSHLSLAAYIARVVYEEYPDGMAPDRWVHRDHLASLAHWPPAQLSQYLKAPWPEWRAVVCHAYTHGEWPEDADWAGVPAALTSVALADRDPLVRNLAVRAFGETVGRAPEGYPIVVEQVTKAAPSPERNLMLRVMARQPVDQEQLRKALAAFLNSDDRDERALAFELLARVAPADLTIEQLRHLLAEPEKQDRNRWSAALETIGISRRDLFSDLLAGAESEQALAISALPPDDELLKRARPVAERLLRGPEPPWKAAWVLRNSPNGGHLLLEAWADTDEKRSRELLVREIEKFLRDRKASEGFAFTTVESRILMDRLETSDDERRLEVFEIIGGDIGQIPRTLRYFPNGEGPRSPAAKVTFLKLLMCADWRVARGAYHYIYCSGLLDETDVQGLVAIYRRDPDAAHSNLVTRLLMDLFPKHPETYAIAKETVSRNAPTTVFARYYLEANPPPAESGSTPAKRSP